jgi:hypothetical protein
MNKKKTTDTTVTPSDANTVSVPVAELRRLADTLSAVVDRVESSAETCDGTGDEILRLRGQGETPVALALTMGEVHGLLYACAGVIQRAKQDLYDLARNPDDLPF